MIDLLSNLLQFIQSVNSTFLIFFLFPPTIHQVEKRVEVIGHVCRKTSTKLQNCLLGTGQDAEKRTVSNHWFDGI